MKLADIFRGDFHLITKENKGLNNLRKYRIQIIRFLIFELLVLRTLVKALEDPAEPKPELL